MEELQATIKEFQLLLLNPSADKVELAESFLSLYTQTQKFEMECKSVAKSVLENVFENMPDNIKKSISQKINSKGF
jgi:hypothetical protein